MSEERPAAYEMLEQVRALDLKLVESKQDELGENHATKIILKEDPEILDTCSMGLLFAIGVLSFHDARPRGVSDMHFVENDQWTVDDLLRSFHFRRGTVGFDADYVRGRMVKTCVEIHPDGTISIEARNRGTSANRWVATLQGKKPLGVVAGGRE